MSVAPSCFSASRGIIISSLLSLIYNYRGFPFFFTFPPYSLDLSLWLGSSISRGTMNSLEAFFYYHKSFSIISSSALGPASPRNQHHSFAQLPCRRETSLLILGPFFLSPLPRSDRGWFITPDHLAKPSHSPHHLPQFRDGF